MALTNAQMVAVRKYAGYQLAGTTMPITDDQDLVYCQFGFVTMSLHKRLTTLDADEEADLIASYLTPLALRQSEIQGAAANLDTDVAAVWTHNKNEVAERRAMFNSLRRDMCDFLGLPYGPALQTTNRMVRC